MEEDFQIPFRNLYKGIIIHDRDGLILAANAPAEAILGTTEKQLIGKPFPGSGWTLVREDGGELTLPFAVKASGKDSPRSTVVGLVPPGGAVERWLSVELIALSSRSGRNASAVCLVLEDVSSQKLAAAALREAEARSRVLFASMHEGVAFLRLIYDKAGTAINYLFVDVNPRFEEITGQPRDKIVGRLASELYSTASPPHLAEFDTAVKRKQAFHFEHHYEPWDQYYYVSASPLDSDSLLSIFFDISDLKKAETALRVEEERFKSLVDSVTDYIYTVTVDEKGRESTVHGPGCITVTGYTSEEYAADPYLWYRMVVDEDKGLVRENLRRLRRGEDMPPFEHRILHKNGSIRWVRNTLVPHRNAIGRLGSYDGLISDITERKQAYFALESSKEYAEKLIQTANTLVVGLDAKGRVTVFNAAAEKITGYTRAEVEDRNWFEIIVPRDRFPLVWEMFSRLPAGGLPERFENPILTKHGDVRHIVWQNTVLMEGGANVGTISFGMDITDIKRSENALRMSEEKYRDIFERAVEGIFKIDPQGGFIDVNPAFASMLGYDSPRDLMAAAKSFSDITAAQTDGSGGLMDALAGSDTVGVEQKLTRRDGVAIWASINARAIRDAAGALTSIEGMTMDYSERKLAEEEKERLQAQLRHAQKMEAIGTFIGGVAHDFNNMLSVIMGYATLLQTGLEEGDALRSYVDQIVGSSERAASLTQSLLAFSRKQPVVMKPIELNAQLRAAEKILRRLLTDDIALTEDFFPRDVVIMGDATQIDQILFNLATNARDAMPNGGALTISTGLVDLDTDFIDVLGFGKPGTYALIQVSDSGIGMDEKTREQIFDPFFTTKEVGKGTGLGLSTVYGIVKQHKGYINVYSEPSKGAAFTIYFPAVEDKFPEEKAISKHLPRGRESILLAEDNQGVRDLMRTVLTRYGYTIVEAVDGEDAIGKFDACASVDLLIVDSVMPKKNGRQVLDEIRKRNRPVKVLFTSGYTRDVILDKGIEEQEVDFLSKPISPHSLLEKVREVLDRRS